jgi:hypothetical protein
VPITLKLTALQMQHMLQFNDMGDGIEGPDGEPVGEFFSVGPDGRTITLIQPARDLLEEVDRRVEYIVEQATFLYGWDRDSRSERGALERVAARLENL